MILHLSVYNWWRGQLSRNYSMQKKFFLMKYFPESLPVKHALSWEDVGKEMAGEQNETP